MPNLPDNPRERHYVQALYHLTKTLDPTRPVIGNDGWESVATDIIGIHDYDDQPERIAKRYHADEVLPRLFKRERPGGRLLVLEGHPHADLPLMLTEFGGIAWRAITAGHVGLHVAPTPEEFAERYERAARRGARTWAIAAGFCYTQFSDTYQEANGLLYADRTPKIPLDGLPRDARAGAPTRRRTRADRQTLADAARLGDAQARADQAGRPLADPVRRDAAPRRSAWRRARARLRIAPNPHLRWHPLRGEWVAYAGHRQHRTFLPPPEYNPLAPSDESDASDRGAAGAVGRRRVREPVSDALP